MQRLISFLIIIFLLGVNSVTACHTNGNNSDTINDGPYVFNIKHKLRVKWVKNNELKEDFITPENFNGIKTRFNLLLEYNDLTNNAFSRPNYSQSYKMIDSICVISDIHGEYNKYLSLLKAMGVIDNNLNWKFGRGHLVVLGDIFDRGNMVTELIWHIFALEIQAAAAGGMVHVLLGNHEIMVLNKTLTYTNEKYKKVEKISNTRYYDLYAKNSILGTWLRSKPVVISINDILFVHGGISSELVDRSLSISRINQIFHDDIIGKEMKGENENEETAFLIQSFGPVWYRGYFLDKEFTENRLNSILKFYGKKYIVVGHTPSFDIISRFNNKVMGVDAGIGMEEPGEMLIYKNGTFYRGYITGKRIKLQ